MIRPLAIDEMGMSGQAMLHPKADRPGAERRDAGLSQE